MTNTHRKIIQISGTRGADGTPMVFVLDNLGDVWITTEGFSLEDTWHKLPNLPQE